MFGSDYFIPPQILRRNTTQPKRVYSFVAGGQLAIVAMAG